MRGPYGSKIPKELPFAISEDAEQYVDTVPLHLAALIEDPADVESIYRLLDEVPDDVSFYSSWLNGLKDFGYADITDQSRVDAFAQAPAALVLQYVTPTGEPFANQPIGHLELAFARKADDVLDDSLRLIYPHNRTDERGRVYLPVFDTPIQLVAPPDPPGHTADYPFEGWLVFPSQIGAPDPIIVTPLPTPTTAQ
ncbi:MAG: hypothetical protein AAF823_16110 [Planctomycetota bacterium]